jgi:hypothetical protein
MVSVMGALSVWGRIRWFTMALGMVWVVVLLVLVGVGTISNARTYSKSTPGRVMDISCKDKPGKMCDVQVAYTVGSDAYKTTIPTFVEYPRGDDVTVYYDPKRPAQAMLSRMGKDTGYLFISLGICFCCVCLITTAFMSRSSTFAAIFGANNLLGRIGF